MSEEKEMNARQKIIVIMPLLSQIPVKSALIKGFQISTQTEKH